MSSPLRLFGNPVGLLQSLLREPPYLFKKGFIGYFEIDLPLLQSTNFSQLLLQFDDGLQGSMSEKNRLQDHLFPHLFRTPLDHDDRIFASGYKEVDVAQLQFVGGGVEDIFSIDFPHFCSCDRNIERNIGEIERGRSPDHSQDGGGMMRIRREDRCDDLGFILESFGKE